LNRICLPGTSEPTKSTKAFIPRILFYEEEFQNRSKTRERDKYYKSGIGMEKLKAKLEHFNSKK